MLYLYILGTIGFTVYGQLILKWRIMKYGLMPGGLCENFLFLVKLLLDPFILSGFIAAFVASLFWMAAMTVADVSFAYPFITAGLTLLTVLLAILLLGEPINIMKGVGITLIILGVITMGLSSSP